MTKRILLVHEFYDILGGGELLSLRMAEACINNGFTVDLLTSSIDIGYVKEIFGVDPEKLFNNIIVVESWKERFLKKIFDGRMIRLRRLLVYEEFFKKIINKYRDDYDLVIETQSNIVAPVDISYIHYPAIIDYLENNASITRWIYNFIVRRKAYSMMKTVAGKILTNSSWTAKKIYDVYGVVPEIVYPPVDIEYFEEPRKCSFDEKEKTILTVSRYTPEKRLEEILFLAKNMRDWKFVIIGTCNDELSHKTYEFLYRIKKTHSITNVLLERNVSRESLLDYMCRAKYYLHPPFPEHFGISVVEAMAAGLVPIVYYDGGAWYDVVSKISPILGYSDIWQVKEIIKYLEENPLITQSIRELCIYSSHDYSREKFYHRIGKVLNKVLWIKYLGV